jgi:hypothetical protein
MEKLTMKAFFNGKNESNAINYSGEKERISTYQVIGKRNGKLSSIVEARFYMGRSSGSSVVYCSLWVQGDNYCSGAGKAGGYGYHKESAALASAISSAGLALFGSNYSTWGNDVKPDFKKTAHIGGCGCESMRMALKAIARAAGAKGQLLIV